MITVIYASLRFTYKIKWLTEVSTVWDEIQLVLDYNIASLPILPPSHAVYDKYLTLLSCQDLATFGRNAKQITSPFHVMVECDGKIYKIITDVTRDFATSEVEDSSLQFPTCLETYPSMPFRCSN